MDWYCVMVKSGGEKAFKKDFEEALTRSRAANKSLPDAKAVFFMKKMRDSKRREFEQALFPGYVFLSAGSVDAPLLQAVKKCRGFYRFLNANDDIQKLQGKDFDYLSNLMKFGETQGISQAAFDENQRIVIKSGPLLGFEGQIVKVNRKRGRATVQIDLCNNEMKFDLAFEEISLNESARTAAN